MLSPSPSPRRRRWFIFIWAAGWIAIGAAAFPSLLVLVNDFQSSRVSSERRLRPQLSKKSFAELSDGDRHPQYNPRQFVWDEVCDVRPRANVDLEFTMGPVGGERLHSYRIRHQQRGIVRLRPIDGIEFGPLILMVGDSHLYGVTDVRSNASSLIEQDLRESGHSRAAVINAACNYYSPYQYALRVRSLWGDFQPSVVVAVYFVGNDFIELDDRNRPFLDDTFGENTRDGHAPPETTTLRKELYQQIAPETYAELFWQGLNQAIYLARRPHRRDPLMAKAIRTVELLQSECREHGALLIIAVIPAYDDYVNYVLPLEGELGLSIIQQRVNRFLREQLVAAVRDRNISVVDLLPVFRSSGFHDIYAGDFHIWNAGHELLADALRDKIGNAIEINPSRSADSKE